MYSANADLPRLTVRAVAVAGAERAKLHSGGLGHRPTFATLADNPNLVEVVGGAAFFHPQVSRAGRGGAAGERSPINVANMSLLTGAKEAHGDNGLVLAGGVAVFTSVEAVQMDEATAAEALTRDLSFLNDEPLGKAPSRYVGAEAVVPIYGGRRRAQR